MTKRREREEKGVESEQMTKRNLVVRISDETKLTQTDVTAVVQLMLDYISDDLAAGKDIEFRNFGVFEIKIRKSRKGRNPNKPGDEVIIPERAVVKFRPGKELKARVEKLKPAKFKAAAKPVAKKAAAKPVAKKAAAAKPVAKKAAAKPVAKKK